MLGVIIPSVIVSSSSREFTYRHFLFPEYGANDNRDLICPFGLSIEAFHFLHGSLLHGRVHVGHDGAEDVEVGALQVHDVIQTFFLRRWLCRTGNTKGGKYHCTADLLFEWFGMSLFCK